MRSGIKEIFHLIFIVSNPSSSNFELSSSIPILVVYEVEKKSSIYMPLNTNYSESCPKYFVKFKMIYLYFVFMGWLLNQKFNIIEYIIALAQGYHMEVRQE